MTTPTAKIIDDKKFMWDGKDYAGEQEAKLVAETYAKENFEVRTVVEGDKWHVYSRRVVEEVVVEGPPPI